MSLFEAGQIIAGKYRLESLLAKGGMGSVWVARNEQLEVPVAVKFMSADAVRSPELVARFEREAKAAAQLRSAQVVTIFEHGVFKGVPFIVMELLAGEDLGKRLRAVGRLSLPETSGIVGQVSKALRRAHESGIIHRDLKPANVFLVRDGEDELVKVLDFGVAKVLSEGSGREEATKTGALIGTPNYMSPEQARRTNRVVDHRSDLWSLGIIAFRALTGKLPYSGDDPVDILVRICTERPPAPSSIAPDLGPDVDRFFDKALAFDPDQRFQSARELADALRALADRASPSPSRRDDRPSWSVDMADGPVGPPGRGGTTRMSQPPQIGPFAKVSGSVPPPPDEPLEYGSPGVARSGAKATVPLYSPGNVPEGVRKPLSAPPPPLDAPAQSAHSGPDLSSQGAAAPPPGQSARPPPEWRIAPVPRGAAQRGAVHPGVVQQGAVQQGAVQQGAVQPVARAEVPGTLTSAAGDVPESPPKKRASPVVWIAVALVIAGVVALAGVLTSRILSNQEEAKSAPSEDSPRMAAEPSASVTAEPSEAASAEPSVEPKSASAEATGTASADPSGTASAEAAPSGSVTAAAPRPQTGTFKAPSATTATKPALAPGVVDPWATPKKKR